MSDQQLLRVGGRLSGLDARERLAVDELAHALAERIADSLLEEAQRDRTVAAALEAVYS
ncbi:MAG: hypothetical protein H0W87_02315 [Actinobacteria bacterium]|nr:hypothetical protein [Actinomycetota bacterium]